MGALVWVLRGRCRGGGAFSAMGGFGELWAQGGRLLALQVTGSGRRLVWPRARDGAGAGALDRQRSIPLGPVDLRPGVCPGGGGRQAGDTGGLESSGRRSVQYNRLPSSSALGGLAASPPPPRPMGAQGSAPMVSWVQTHQESGRCGGRGCKSASVCPQGPPPWPGTRHVCRAGCPEGPHSAVPAVGQQRHLCPSARGDLHQLLPAFPAGGAQL